MSDGLVSSSPTGGGNAIAGNEVFPFKWYFRPEAVPVIQIVEDKEEIPFEKLASVLQEINKRQWQAVRQVLIEAKLKAEQVLRQDNVVKDPQQCAYYVGWLNYANYILANAEGLRAGMVTTERIQEQAGIPLDDLS
jgi:hypothetical protein